MSLTKEILHLKDTVRAYEDLVQDLSVTILNGCPDDEPKPEPKPEVIRVL